MASISMNTSGEYFLDSCKDQMGTFLSMTVLKYSVHGNLCTFINTLHLFSG